MRSAAQGSRPDGYADQPPGRQRLVFNAAIYPEAALAVATSGKNALPRQRADRVPATDLGTWQ
jgi:hypothetical protein